MTALSNALKTLAAARSLAAVNAARNEISRQAEAGTLAEDAAAALLTAARVRLDELTDQGEDGAAGTGRRPASGHDYRR
jgi:hypothetical protein